MIKPLEVVCALIIHENGKFLACQRGNQSTLPDKWEFPGGKIEPGESKEDALKRELWEELEVRISIQKPLDTVNHQYPDFDIALSPFICKITSPQPPKPLEHKEIRWVTFSEASCLDWADADLPIIEQYKILL